MIDFLKQKLLPTQDLEEAEDHKRLWIATAVVFCEIALADGEFDDEERSLILDLLCKKHGLPKSDADQVLEQALAACKDRIDFWQYTNIINKNFEPKERLIIVENLWTLVLVDGHLDQHEEYMTRKLADLLHISHKDFIGAKMKALREMS
jgi:uncharacterized tellurite resistance protein B-like protein